MEGIFLIVFLSVLGSSMSFVRCENSCKQEEQNPTSQQYFVKHTNKWRLLKNILSESGVQSWAECGFSCLETRSCVAYNYKQKSSDDEINCQLSHKAGNHQVVGTQNEDNGWILYEAVVDEMYGTQTFPGESCSDILERRYAGNAEDGVYWMRLDTGKRSFPVFCDMRAGGWTLVFKAIAGVPGRIAGYWKPPVTSFECSLAALNKHNYFKHHYANRIIKDWSTFKPKEARVVVYTKGKEMMVLRFDVYKSDNINWFSLANLRESPWLDIRTEKKNYFSLEGYCVNGKCRDFHINNVYPGCANDLGWLSVGDGRACSWERQYPEDYILYSHRSSKGNYNNKADFSNGDVFAVYVR